MPSRRSRPHRLLLPTALAAILAAEITGLAIARSMAAASAAVPEFPSSATSFLVADGRIDGPIARAHADRLGRPDAARDVAAAVASTRMPPTPANLRAPAPALPATVHATTGSPTHPSAAAAPPSYRGRNHVWIPSLGINRSVQAFPCSRSREPDAGVYRWGCAGRNNVYLMSHAWSTFKPLHDAYVAGRLRPGLRVWYGDGAGRVHQYRVAWWRVVAPTTAASWAWAAQARPSMTLQTCVGSRSQYRLMVRLLQVA